MPGVIIYKDRRESENRRRERMREKERERKNKRERERTTKSHRNSFTDAKLCKREGGLLVLQQGVQGVSE